MAPHTTEDMHARMACGCPVTAPCQRRQQARAQSAARSVSLRCTLVGMHTTPCACACTAAPPTCPHTPLSGPPAGGERNNRYQAAGSAARDVKACPRPDRQSHCTAPGWTCGHPPATPPASRLWSAPQEHRAPAGWGACPPRPPPARTPLRAGTTCGGPGGGGGGGHVGSGAKGAKGERACRAELRGERRPGYVLCTRIGAKRGERRHVALLRRSGGATSALPPPPLPFPTPHPATWSPPHPPPTHNAPPPPPPAPDDLVQ